MKLHAHGGRLGCVQTRKARSTGTLVSVYVAEQANLDSSGGPWATLCEEHHNVINHATRALASEWAVCPEEWCEECQAKLRGSEQT